MFDNTFLEKLKDKYKYSDKVINALSKIIPAMISYYGKEYEEIILNAILDCEIVPCDSHQTISKVLADRKLTKCVYNSDIFDIDLKRSESVYVPNIKISYNETTNSYEIDKIDRVIVTSHTYNYDSLKGLEVLSHALCHLVKSYNNEFIIDENVITVRSGVSYEKRKIIYDDEIYMELIEEKGKGLEEGFNLFDTEEVVSSIYKESYKSYDFNSIYTVAALLKGKYDLKDEINVREFDGGFDDLESKYGKEAINNLSLACDKCVFLENDMYLAFTREDKDKCAFNINKILMDDVYNILIDIYKSKDSIKK